MLYEMVVFLLVVGAEGYVGELFPNLFVCFLVVDRIIKECYDS